MGDDTQGAQEEVKFKKTSGLDLRMCQGRLGPISKNTHQDDPEGRRLPRHVGLSMGSDQRLRTETPGDAFGQRFARYDLFYNVEI
ncbi:hypothetical protein AUC68_04650 [Methyloceanibacter methanicus]|uniref:Uncharacterized protein n=1 Tax=Methyloceanibacter methanicus TaxID=1774968 RepID=A0A1E3W0F4_9HYPH|nr:hypothetical protein AUC68_04650 [Methyloceanibacter methanicus]